jgi:hypothetical protein
VERLEKKPAEAGRRIIRMVRRFFLNFALT